MRVRGSGGWLPWLRLTGKEWEGDTYVPGCVREGGGREREGLEGGFGFRGVGCRWHGQLRRTGGHLQH